MTTLFEYAILRHPKPPSKDEHAPASELVVEPTYVLANNQDEAAMKAARAIPDSHADHLDEVEVLIRPFA